MVSCVSFVIITGFVSLLAVHISSMFWASSKKAVAPWSVVKYKHLFVYCCVCVGRVGVLTSEVL